MTLPEEGPQGLQTAELKLRHGTLAASPSASAITRMGCSEGGELARIALRRLDPAPFGDRGGGLELGRCRGFRLRTLNWPRSGTRVRDSLGGGEDVFDLGLHRRAGADSA